MNRYWCWPRFDPFPTAFTASHRLASRPSQAMTRLPPKQSGVSRCSLPNPEGLGLSFGDDEMIAKP